jgi:hypothetical protein
MIFALHVIRITLGKSSLIEQLFFDVYLQAKHLSFSFDRGDNISDLGNMIESKEMQDTRRIRIAETYTVTKNLLRTNDDRFKFFFSLDTAATRPEAVENLSKLMRGLGEKINKIDWIVGSVGLSEFKQAPLLFVVKNSRIECVCTDYLDILVLIDIFKVSQKNRKNV